MKHFRAAYALEPTYVPAWYNMEQYAQMYSTGKCAFTEEDCPVKNDHQFETDLERLKVAEIDKATVFIAVTDDDCTNICATQIAKKVFHIEKVVARIQAIRIPER